MIRHTLKNIIQPKSHRLAIMLKAYAKIPPFSNGMMAYASMMEMLNEREDVLWGEDHWSPPRTFLDGVVTDRIYPTHSESFQNIDGFPGVTHLIHTKHSIFMSRHGAVQVQLDNGLAAGDCHLEARSAFILLNKLDAYGDEVWHDKNRR